MKTAARALLVLVLALLVAAPAAASPETLRRSVGNILFSPLDFAFAPVQGAKVAYTNLHDIDDTPGVRTVFIVPGFIWNTGLTAGAATIRMFIGLVELLPGLGLYFMEADLDPLYDPPEKADALVDIETDPLWIKFGVNYLD